MCSNAVSFGFVSVLQWLNLTGENMKNEGLTLNQLTERNAELVTEVEKLRSERDQLAAENVALKSAVTKQIELRSEIKRAGRPPHADFWVQSICEAEDRVSKALNGTPATDRIVAGIKADRVESGIKTIMTMLNHQAPGVSDAINVLRVHSSELREGADK